ncbi:MAG: hypothetical protein IJI67_01265 [Clostridia bacterium]|nr:hypothetical protein [Clostridia bacterium]
METEKRQQPEQTQIVKPLKQKQPAQEKKGSQPRRVMSIKDIKSQSRAKAPVQPKTVKKQVEVKKEPALPKETAKQEKTPFLSPAATRKEKKSGRFNFKNIKKIFTPVSNLLDSIQTDFSDRSAIRKTLIALFKLKVPICILLAVVIVLSGGLFLFQSEETATTEMSLNYEESAYGLNPNSTRFNVYGLASPEVVQKALNYVGVEPDNVDVTNLINNISISPTNKKAFNEEELFITTTYRITITKPSDVKGVSTEELLHFLCKAYKDHLYTNYTENRSILGFDIEKLNDGEFMEVADLLDLKAQQIEKYLNGRVKQSKTFTEKESDETFKSLVQKVEDIRNYDIAKYRAFVIEAGCSHDKVRYLRSLSYINRMKDLDYTKEMAAYTVHNDGIKMYNEAMISNVLIPSIDQNKKTYYMSKTKTGMDYMASRADDHLESAQAIQKEIETNNELMKKMSAGTNDKADIDKATGMIENIRQKFADLSGQIEIVDKAYIKYKTKDYLTFKTTTPSLLQRIEPLKLMVVAAALLLIIYLVIWYRFKNYNQAK